MSLFDDNFFGDLLAPKEKKQPVKRTTKPTAAAPSAPARPRRTTIHLPPPSLLIHAINVQHCDTCGESVEYSAGTLVAFDHLDRRLPFTEWKQIESIAPEYELHVLRNLPERFHYTNVSVHECPCCMYLRKAAEDDPLVVDTFNAVQLPLWEDGTCH